MGRAWLPGDLVTVDIISIAKHGLPQQAIGVILLLKRETKMSYQSPGKFPLHSSIG